ncbi:MAG: hypothetical protein ABIR11_01665 [Candidatus Limnocylindrales bacterium]
MSDPNRTATTEEHATIPAAHGTSVAVEGPHGAATDHGDGGHGHDDHGHGSGELGPIDWRMWAVGVIGVIVALIVTAGFVFATSFAFNA